MATTPSKEMDFATAAMHDDVPVTAMVNDAIVRSARRKVDRRLIPVLALLYLLAFLDRGNSEWLPLA